MAIAVAAFLLAFLLSYAVTPIIRFVATRIGFVDKPDGGRKIQAKPVSLGGGLSLVIVTPIAIGIIWWMMGDAAPYMLSGYPVNHSRSFGMVVATALAAAILTVVGLIDDSVGMPGSRKLLFQFVAALLVAGVGLHVTDVSFGGIHLPLGHLGTLAAVIWLLASINSFNLIDGVDGLAGSVGVVFCLAVGTLSLVQGQNIFDAVLVFALAGSILGFLRFNFAPATIYMGDTGSMIVGLILGAITLRISTKQAATVAFSVPLAIWAIPIFDSTAAVLRRKLTGRSIYATDRGHFHHVLLTRGMNSSQAVAFITCMCAITSIAAVISVVLEQPWIGMVTVACVIGFLIFSRVFGHIEFLLLNSRILGMGQVTDSIDATSRQSTIARKGHAEWDSFWETIVGKVDEFKIVKLSLHLTMTEIGEDFFATWTRSGHSRRDVTWSIDLPFVYNDITIGRLKASGLQTTDSTRSNALPFMHEVEAIERELLARMAQHGSSRGKAPPAEPLSSDESSESDPDSGDSHPDVDESGPDTEIAQSPAASS
ncbi:MAG: undecaprenyl/decaprenyl-phosphate alpha-N-acetylglucosaminyl 1-phosphate transferase [Planctomycetales bacterium]|nr:undecaprenyl/decaprenyl-phosphate alpha-N-acetylglucosaminyl 1-phosphate transferase [Planctomycetales bacterium]